VNARSALFDVYGDHLRSRGGHAPVASLVRMLAPLGVAPPAVRTAISRMARQGWLRSEKLPSGPGYALTPKAVRRLDEAATRIYRTADRQWDGRWHLVVTAHVRDRSTRERLRSAFGYLGFAPLADSTWIGPRTSDEVDAILDAEGLRAERFVAEHDGMSAALVARTWDLGGLAKAYERWLGDAVATVEGLPDKPSDEEAFAARSALVHEWRMFLFRDPGLPRTLLPDAWPGDKAAAYFDSESARLLPASRRFVDACLEDPRG
jgi:phenylacetic acid degradation operon negative regulatory protein